MRKTVLVLSCNFMSPGRQGHIFAKSIQGDTSGRTKPPVDIDVKVAFYYKGLLLKRNFQINVNGRFGPT